MLAEVVPLTVPWSKLPAETELEYQAFVLWLHAPRVEGKRPIPFDPSSATRHRWAERATAHDQVEEQAGTVPEVWTETEARFKRVVAREVLKLERASLTQQTGIPIPKDLQSAFLIARGTPEVQGVELPVSDMTTEELRTVQEADRILAKVGGKRA